MRYRSLFVMHRSLGVLVAALVLLLAVTGIMLNHGNALALDRTSISNRAILDWYGVDIPQASIGYPVAAGWIIPLGEQVFFNERMTAEDGAPLLGATQIADTVAVAWSERLLLLNTSGEIIESITPGTGLPCRMTRIGIADGRLAIQCAHSVYRADPEMISWAPVSDARVSWSMAQNPPDGLLLAYTGHGISAERFVQDLHSGRIFGAAGVLVMDFVALALLLLAVSGVALWFRVTWLKRRSRRRRDAAQETVDASFRITGHKLDMD